MLRTTTPFLHRHSNVRGITTSLAASVVLGVLPLWYALVQIRAGAPGAVPLDTTGGYTPDAAYAMIARYTANFGLVLAPALLLAAARARRTPRTA